MNQALPAAAGPSRQNRQQRRQAERQARRNRKSGGGQGAALAAADREHRAGRLAEAESLYRQVLQAAPDNLVALSQLGALCAQTERFEEALALLQRAAAIEPAHTPTQMNLGFVHAAEGRTAAADACFRAGARLEPDNPETQKNYGGWCHQQGRLEEAAAALEKGLASAPRDLPRQSLLGQTYGQLRRFEEAKDRFHQGLALFADSIELHAHFGVLLASQGQSEEALGHLARGFPHMAGSRRYQALFLEALAEARLESYRPELEPAIMACLDGGLVEAQRLSPALGGQLWFKYARDARFLETGPEGKPQIRMDGVLLDPPLIRLLGELVNVNLGLEALMVPLRRLLLGRMRQEAEIEPAVMRFMAAFAMQCHANSYILETSAEEQESVAALAAELEARIGGLEGPETGLPPDFETAVALFAMYRPIHRLAGFERLAALPLEAWSAPLRPLVERALLNPAREQALKAEIAGFGRIEDAVSRAVRSQYEDNPYPRWISLPRTERGPLQALIRAGSVELELPEGIDEDLSCLIAGCGTGRHPISVAMVLRHARITAIDLSLSSLAYAKRMAGRYGLDNLEFLHGDLLEVGALGRRYRLIESMGVLHHMDEPERGLESLLGVLEPGGILHLGLYSAPARRWVSRARERIAELGLEPTPEAIRGFRRRIILGQEPDLREMVGMSDFFDLDSFRDLVFHVQEHQFTIPTLAALLERQGLAFLGFSGMKRRVLQAFTERHGAGALADLEAWHGYESENPDTFRGMYKFWCRPTEGREAPALAPAPSEART